MRSRSHALCVPVAMAAALSACSPGVCGVYEDVPGQTRYAFDGAGGAVISILGASVEAAYSRHGDEVIVTSPQGTTVLTLERGALVGPMGLVLRLKPTPGDDTCR